MFHLLVRILSAAIGCVSLYMAFFLYEDERGQLQNRLEELWISIDDEGRKARDRNAAFLRGIVRIVSDAFDRIFGPEILSARAVVVSLCVIRSPQQMAAHESARTTGLYDRRNDEISLDEVERIGI